MISLGANLNRVGGLLARVVGEREAARPARRQRVRRSMASADGLDSWERRIVAADDGRPADEVIDSLFAQELAMGGWVADLGLYRRLYEEELLADIKRLAAKGYLRLVPDGAIPEAHGG